MRALLLFLLSCLPCFAQLNVQQPMFALTSTAPPVDPSGNGGLAYWWEFTDMATNNVVATNWVDRIAGLALTQSDFDHTPTNTEFGVYFFADASNHDYLLQNTQYRFGWSNAWCIVFQRDGSLAGQRIVVGWWTPHNATYGWMLFGNYIYYGDDAIGPVALTTNTTTTAISDYIYQAATADNLSGDAYGWYNGYKQLDATDHNGYKLRLDAVGDAYGSSAGFGYKGWIRRIMVWTNRLSDLQVLTLHTNCATTFGYTP